MAALVRFPVQPSGAIMDTFTFSAGRLVSEFMLGFTALISIINPLAMAFVLLDRTRYLSEHERALISRKIAFNSFCVLVVVFFLGTEIMGFFGISLEALRLAGGFVVAVSGWTMLNAPAESEAVHADGLVKADPSRMAFFPLTIPLTTGPGAIATTIALSAGRTRAFRGAIESAVVTVLVCLAVTAVVYLIYSRAERLARLLGPEGTIVVTRISAFLLLCIGVQIMLTGAAQFLAERPHGG